MQDYTPIMKVLETLQWTTCRPESDLTFNREFDLHLAQQGKFGMNFPEGDKY